MFDVVAAVDASGLGAISALLLLLLLISLTACKRGNLPGKLSFISFREDNDIEFFIHLSVTILVKVALVRVSG